MAWAWDQKASRGSRVKKKRKKVAKKNIKMRKGGRGENQWEKRSHDGALVGYQASEGRVRNGRLKQGHQDKFRVLGVQDEDEEGEKNKQSMTKF